MLFRSLLDQKRTAWLFPADLVRAVDEVRPEFPARLIAKTADAEGVLSKRTLTALYNERPDWLIEAHRELDHAVAKAYGWRSDISTDEALENLLALNLSRGAQAT